MAVDPRTYPELPVGTGVESGGPDGMDVASGGTGGVGGANSPSVADAAAAALRGHVDPGWVRVRTGTLDRLRETIRPSPALRGAHDDGEYVVAGQVLRVVVRNAVESVAGARAVRVGFTVDDDGALDAAEVRIAAAYGTALGPLTRAVRKAVRGGMVAALGAQGLGGRVDVTVVDVYR